jgi:hypothetical protein
MLFISDIILVFLASNCTTIGINFFHIKCVIHCPVRSVVKCYLKILMKPVLFCPNVFMPWKWVQFNLNYVGLVEIKMKFAWPYLGRQKIPNFTKIVWIIWKEEQTDEMFLMTSHFACIDAFHIISEYSWIFGYFAFELSAHFICSIV